MAIHLHHHSCFNKWRSAFDKPGDATHVAWSLDDLPELAHAAHILAVLGAIHGTPGADIDAAILDRLRGTTTSPADGVPATQ